MESTITTDGLNLNEAFSFLEMMPEVAEVLPEGNSEAASTFESVYLQCSVSSEALHFSLGGIIGDEVFEGIELVSAEMTPREEHLEETPADEPHRELWGMVLPFMEALNVQMGFSGETSEDAVQAPIVEESADFRSPQEEVKTSEKGKDEIEVVIHSPVLEGWPLHVMPFERRGEEEMLEGGGESLVPSPLRETATQRLVEDFSSESNPADWQEVGVDEKGHGEAIPMVPLEENHSAWDATTSNEETLNETLLWMTPGSDQAEVKGEIGGAMPTLFIPDRPPLLLRAYAGEHQTYGGSLDPLPRPPEWIESLGQILVRWVPTKSNELKLNLHPAELGSIEIKVREEQPPEGPVKYHMTFICGEARVKELIREHWAELRGQFEAHHLSLGEGQFMMEEHRRRESSPSYPFKEESRQSEPHKSSTTAPASPPSGGHLYVGIDYFV